MPMQAEGDHDPGPFALTTGLAPEEIRRRLADALARVPGAIGINNHMGSRVTADRDGQSEQHEERHIGALHQGARRPGSLAAANRFEPIHGPVERRRAGKSTIHV